MVFLLSIFLLKKLPDASTIAAHSFVASPDGLLI